MKQWQLKTQIRLLAEVRVREKGIETDSESPQVDFIFHFTMRSIKQI
jgi:hypothetical protein